MKSPVLAALVFALAAAPALAQDGASSKGAANWWSQAGGESGPQRTVWAAQKAPETL